MKSPTDRASLLSNSRVQLALSLFTLLYIFFSFFWFGRQTTILTEEPLKPLRMLWFFFGLEQDWRLFGPEVRRFNCFPSAIVSLDGARLLWEAPSSAVSADANRFRANLFRKFSVDYLPWSLYSGYWQRFSDSLGKEFSTSGCEARSVSLILNFEQIDPPQKKLRHRQQLPTYWQSLIFYEKYKAEEGRP